MKHDINIFMNIIKIMSVNNIVFVISAYKIENRKVLVNYMQ